MLITTRKENNFIQQY